MDENGETPRAATSGDCISKAARFHSASLGMIRLHRMPILTAVWLRTSDPNCSTQPPTGSPGVSKRRGTQGAC